MGTGVSTQDGSARRARTRLGRAVGIAVAATIILGAVPGIASATPVAPSDAEETVRAYLPKPREIIRESVGMDRSLQPPLTTATRSSPWDPHPVSVVAQTSAAAR